MVTSMNNIKTWNIKETKKKNKYIASIFVWSLEISLAINSHVIFASNNDHNKIIW